MLRHIRRAGIEDFPMPAPGVIQFKLLRVGHGKAAIIQQIGGQADDVAEKIQVWRIQNFTLQNRACRCLANSRKQRVVPQDYAIFSISEWQRSVLGSVQLSKIKAFRYTGAAIFRTGDTQCFRERTIDNKKQKSPPFRRLEMTAFPNGQIIAHKTIFSSPR